MVIVPPDLLQGRTAETGQRTIKHLAQQAFLQTALATTVLVPNLLCNW